MREDACARAPDPEARARAPEPGKGQARLARAARRSESTSETRSGMRVLYPTRDPARVGIQSTFLDPDSEFYPCRSLRLRIQRLWILTRAGSPLGNQESVLQEISFSRQQPAARQGAQPSTSNVQPAGRRPLLGGVLRRCSPGGLPEIRGVLPRRRASSRTPLASWAPPNWHLGTSFLL